MCFVVRNKEGDGEGAGEDGQEWLFLAAGLLQSQLPPWWPRVHALAGTSWCLQMLFVTANALQREGKIHAKTMMSTGQQHVQKVPFVADLFYLAGS